MADSQSDEAKRDKETAKSSGVAEESWREDVALGRFLLGIYQKALQLSEKELYEYFLGSAVSLTHSTIGFFHFVSNDQKTIQLTTWNREALKTCTANYNAHYPVEDAGNWADSIRRGHSIVYNDFKNAPNKKGLPKGHVPIKRIMSVPVIEQGKVHVVFGVGNKKAPYQGRDIIRLEVVANELNRILKQRQAEHALRESEENYRRRFEDSRDAVFVAEVETGNIVDCNGAACKLVGREKSEIVGHHQSSLHPPELVKDGFTVDFKEHVREKTGRIIESKAITKDGKVLPIEIKASPFEAYGKNLVEATFRDITEPKKAEEALAKQAALIELSPDAIIIKDVNGTITFWSEGAEKLYGWTKEEAIGKKIKELLNTKYPQPDQDVFQLLKNSGRWTGELFHQTKDGDALTVQSFWLAKIDGEGQVIEILESNIDITERKKMQTKLEEYSRNLEKLVEQKTSELRDKEKLATIGQVTAMVGHDLRSPLQTIEGEVYLAKETVKGLPGGEARDSLLEGFEIVLKQVAYMNGMISDIQDTTRSFKPVKSRFGARQFLAETLDEIHVPKEVKAKFDLAQTLPTFNADRALLKRILINLINNAVQAMPEGGTLTIRTALDKGNAVVAVEDTGVGISEAAKPKIFTPLFTTKCKGQGLGLAICKRAVEAQGGNISFTSEEGKGTTFTVMLPI